MKIRPINGDQDLELQPETPKDILLIGKLSGKLSIATYESDRSGPEIGNRAPAIDIPIGVLIQAALKP